MNFKIAFALGACLAVFPNIKAPDYCPDPTLLVAPVAGLLGFAYLSAIDWKSMPAVQKLDNFLDDHEFILPTAMAALLAAAITYVYRDNKKRFHEANQKINTYLASKGKGDLIINPNVDVIYSLIKPEPNGTVIRWTELDFWRDQKKSWLPF